MTPWPRAVWQSPWLRGLDGAARAQIESAGRVRSLGRGAQVFGAGEPADAFFVVGQGLVDVRAVRRGDAEASAIRRAVAGDAVGEEAIVRAGAARAGEATCATDAVVAEVPVAVFRRAAERAGAPQAATLEQALRRAAAADVLRSSSLARALSERDVEALLACTDHRSLARGDVLFQQGEPATHAYVVADGMVQVQTEDDGRVQVRAYLTRGDLVADDAVESGGLHEVTVTACGPAWVLAIAREPILRVARRSPEAMRRARRLASSAPLPEATRHVLGDLWRFAVAGSMLIIDDEVCVRCGHCAWSCAEAHGDGVSRLVRRGEKVTVRDASDGGERALVIPGSCQHCKHPACMIECPTGAIGRDPRGQVFVREELCVGCGLCAKACPWGSVQMAPRRSEPRKRLPILAHGTVGPAPQHEQPSAAVAVKCDMCRDLDGGPACVNACPVDAIARVEPEAAMADVRKAVGGHAARQGLPEQRLAWPWVAGAAVVAAAAARVPVTTWGARLATGLVVGALLLALMSYVVVKRTRLARGRGRSGVRPHTIAHLALGVAAAGVVAAHAGVKLPPNAAGALVVAFALASLTGVAAALAYRLVPRALARVERQARLPEDLPGRARELDERAFGALTGRSDATKAVYGRLLAPYGRAPLGWLLLVMRGATLRDEEKRLRARIRRLLGARADTLDGLDDMIRLVVERRAVTAQRVLQATLRAWVPAHVVAVAVAVVLLLVHVVVVARGR